MYTCNISIIDFVARLWNTSHKKREHVFTNKLHRRRRSHAMATSEEVAKLAGVSRATVSRVLNGSARTSDAVRSRVHAAMKALGYEPDVVAQSLVRQRSR